MAAVTFVWSHLVARILNRQELKLTELLIGTEYNVSVKEFIYGLIKH